MKNKKIWIVVAVIILLMCMGFEIYNFNLKKNKIARLEEKVEALTTDDGFVTTQSHLLEVQTLQTAYDNFKIQIRDIAKEKGQVPSSDSSEDIVEAVSNIKTGKKVVRIGGFSEGSGNTTSINVSSYPDYQSFTINNFILEVVNVNYIAGGGSIGNIIWSPSKSYNASTGIFTLGKTYNVYDSTHGSGVGGNIYLVY